MAKAMRDDGGQPMTDLAGWIGRTRTDTAILDPEIARRFAAAIGADLAVVAHFPPLGHWAYFNDAAWAGRPRP